MSATRASINHGRERRAFIELLDGPPLTNTLGITRGRRMAIENMLVIGDLASLQMWRRQLRNIMQPRNLPAVQFQLQEFSGEQNRNFSALAGGFQRACGCASGGFFMSVTVVAIIVSYFVSGNHLSNINLPHVLSFVGITVLATLCGKLLGLFWARWRLLRLATSMHNMIVRAAQRAVTESI